MDKKLKKEGFTLAELLVVVAILAVLVAVSIPIFTGQLGKAKDTVCKNNIETIRHLYVVETLQNGAPTDEAGAQDILAKAITQADDGNYITGTNTYEAACGGTCTATFSVDKMSIVKIECSEHGENAGGSGHTITYSEWETGKAYKVGDEISADGYIFSCTSAHTSGETTYTRNPATKLNNSWRVIGYTGEVKSYSTSVRYDKGIKVTYLGKLYERKDHLLTGGQAPYTNASSNYWTLLGPAT